MASLPVTLTQTVSITNTIPLEHYHLHINTPQEVTFLDFHKSFTHKKPKLKTSTYILPKITLGNSNINYFISMPQILPNYNYHKTEFMKK